MHIQIALFDGFDPLDVIAPYEVLYAGRTASDGAVTVELVSAEGPREVVSGTGGLVLRATGALDLEHADMVLVPGASGRIGEPGEVPDVEMGAGEWKQDEFIPVLLGRTLNTELPALLKQAMDDPHIMVATVCGGSLVLAMAGLLEGRHVTTHHLGLDMLDATGAHAVRARVVDDGDLVTGAGVTSGLDLGLYLLEREVGPRIAHAVEELFAHERRGTVWRAQGPTPAAL
ncbi:MULTISPECIES: DJ-1/PfpI family protein [Streptomyces]|uniref:DJ-1/PfpI family protein n=1 Tax=Streptomyces doudnae TaxID=3075536 RepID=A0ABD5F1Z4_9ACTN|nr:MULTISPECIES: DJ-1/PfpI family protein [unclassified Streptomyces]MDT0440264.1 DJ-1/PfpI family protein [Streptomyces sp. DSM 41981]MYQ69316.1 DJ-1/PfpI family protein [Streptomyces sp. SID4950]SCE52839.1 DJ-1/PfpI family protein [Streptomyces sp. SolWspMP-5a-2]